MLKKRNLLYGLAAFLLATMIALPVNAGTLTIDTVYKGYGHTSYYANNPNKDGGIVPYLYDGSSYGEIVSGAGQFQITDSEGLMADWGFCVDLNTLVGYGKNDFDETAGLTIPNQAYVEWLLDSFSGGASKWSTNGAALQLAIWEVIYDGSGVWNFDSDGIGNDTYENDQSGTFTAYQNFYYDRGNAALIDTNLNPWYDFYMDELSQVAANIDANGYESKGTYFVAGLSQDGKPTQNLIINVVPEPTTLLLFGFGLLGMGAISRKRQM